MYLLAFETSAKSASVAIVHDGLLLGEYHQNSGQTHSRTLMKMAQNLMENCDLSPNDIGAVACAIGPGSFTGVRIGLAAAKGFAWGREIPLIGVSTLEAMAKGALPIATSTGGLVDTIKDGVDGFRTEVFFAKGIKVYGSNLIAQKLKNNVNAYADTLLKALNCYYTSREQLNIMTQNAIKKDFGWNVEGGSVYKYYKLFMTGSL